jgi:hypothetical protein
MRDRWARHTVVLRGKRRKYIFKLYAFYIMICEELLFYGGKILEIRFVELV